MEHLAFIKGHNFSQTFTVLLVMVTALGVLVSLVPRKIKQKDV